MSWNELWDGFDWDDGNSTKNWFGHGITQAQCEQAFTNSPLLIVPDTKHSELEERLTAFGRTDAGKTLTIAFTVRGKKIRPISARAMSRKERKGYAEQKA